MAILGERRAQAVQFALALTSQQSKAPLLLEIFLPTEVVLCG
jgi:hypothetical protein